MSKKVVFLLGLFFIIFNLSFVNSAEASLGRFEQGLEIRVVQICATCTFNNITSITYPNSTNFTGVIQMTRIGSEYNYTIPSTDVLPIGNYKVNGVGDINGENRAWIINFEVTKTGTELTTSKSIIYILLAFGVFLFFGISLFFAMVIPYSNETNNSGAVIQVTRKKYLKLAFIMFTYVLFVWFNNIMIGLSVNFVELTLFEGFFGFAFESLNNFAIPFSLFILSIMLLEIIRDANLNKRFQEMGRALR